MFQLLGTIFIIVILSTCSCQVIPTIEQRDAAVVIIRSIINENTEAIQEDETEKVRHPFRAGFVRLAFHDCVHGTGFTAKACDGCVNHDNPENAGLKRYTDELDAAYDDITNGIAASMSNADFYTLAGVVALDEAAEPGSNPSTHFNGLALMKFGRQDPADCDSLADKDEADDFLSPHIGRLQGSNGIDKFFRHRFGFTLQDSVAILGAHTLGRAHFDNSKFDGLWTTAVNSNGAQSDFLNNRYYKHIAGDWIQVIAQNQGEQGNVQWKRTNGGAIRLMLNVDMAIAWDLHNHNAENPLHNTPPGEVTTCEIDVVEDEIGAKKPGAQTCEVSNCCPKSIVNQSGEDEETNLFYRYATNNVRWVNEFRTAYFKMIFNDAAGLSLPTN